MKNLTSCVYSCWAMIGSPYRDFGTRSRRRGPYSSPILVFRIGAPAFPPNVKKSRGNRGRPFVEIVEAARDVKSGGKRATVNRFQNIDWTKLYKVLLVHATGILRRYRGPDTFDGGQDCEDVVAEVLKNFYRSPNGLGWKQNKGKLETYLGTVVHNKLVDRLRRQKHVSGSLDDPDFSPLAHASPVTTAPERARSNTKDALYSLAKGDAELQDLITA